MLDLVKGSPKLASRMYTLVNKGSQLVDVNRNQDLYKGNEAKSGSSGTSVPRKPTKVYRKNTGMQTKGNKLCACEIVLMMTNT